MAFISNTSTSALTIVWRSLGPFTRNGVYYADDLRFQYSFSDHNVNAATYASRDFGSSWTPSGSFSYVFFPALSSSGQYMLVSQNGDGIVRISNDFGSSWRDYRWSYWWTAGTVCAVSLTGQYMAFGGTDYGSSLKQGPFYFSSDYGVTWSQRSNAPRMGWARLMISPSGSKLFAEGWFGNPNVRAVYLSANYGVDWEFVTGIPQVSPAAFGSFAYSFSPSNELSALYVYTIQSGSPALLRSTNFGTSWSNILLPAVFLGITSSNTGQLVAGFTAASIYVSVDYGYSLVLTFNVTGCTNIVAAGDPQVSYLHYLALCSGSMYAGNLTCKAQPDGATKNSDASCLTRSEI